MAERKRVTTAPLTQEEIAEALYDIPEDEFLEQFDQIFSRDLDLPETLEELISLDDYMDNELREMFQSIIAQYIRPVEYAVSQIRAGEQSKRIAEEGIEALSPILSASESLDYEDLTALLRQIEGPLRELADGTRRRLVKKDVAELGGAWDQLEAILRHEKPEQPQVPTPIALGSLPRFLDGVTAAHIRSLRTAGLTTLQDLAGAPLGDLVDVTGLPDVIAERMKSFAIGVVATATAGGNRRSAAQVPAGWMRVQIDSEIFKGRLTFEYGTLGRYLEPILARLAEGEAGAAAAPPPKAASRKSRAKRTDSKKGGQ